jgi:hypothetical protein
MVYREIRLVVARTIGSCRNIGCDNNNRFVGRVLPVHTNTVMS